MLRQRLKRVAAKSHLMGADVRRRSLSVRYPQVALSQRGPTSALGRIEADGRDRQLVAGTVNPKLCR
jgi:hypothetical protein